ncbi:hypothetical protein AOCH_000741 [Aspergillus ochraceoroseus]|uniref:Uncharacterized protein n=1 Tax=Aspergillus ochraceoroseus TaxID=138278 RepID=A0A0F8WN74_9EURO|nr:hypothetical protein AOCH_000741 [Aspergillus ochraceoroseus]
MADSPEPPSRRPDTISNLSHLQYPTLPPLSASVEEWLSRSRPIIMTSTPPTDHPPKSLSESWATLSVSDVHSEDGAPSEQTDVGSLIDQTGPDDVASLDGGYSSSDEVDGHYDEGPENDNYDSRSEMSESQELHPMFPQIGRSIDDSNLTAKTALRQSTESIEFVEPDNWPEVERVELKHTIRLFEGPEITELGDTFAPYLEDSTLMATVQQTMTKKSIDTDKPFRVLYVGSSEFRSIVLDKLGDVLVASTSNGFESSSAESSRYHVVPTSFGAGAVPNFAELLPIHVQLIVDECLEAFPESHIDKPSTINLKLKNRPSCSSLWTGTEYCLSSSTEWTLPDVAITFLSNSDTEIAMRTQDSARVFMERHGVPTMAISEKPLWTMSRDLVPVNHHSLHMCLESRHSFTGRTTVLERYPIDLNTFESITPGQLNRNLASLTSIYPRKHYVSTSKTPTVVATKPSFDMKKYTRKLLPLPYLRNETEFSFVLRLITITLISAVTLTFGHSALKATTICISDLLTRPAVSSQVPSSTSGISTTAVFPTQELKQTSIPVLSSLTSDIQVLGEQLDSQTQKGHLGALSPVEKQATPETFEVQVVGDCHLVIKPPHKSLAGRRQPKFSVQVSRRGQPLQYELSRLFEGVYSLKMNREEAQTTSLDLGTPWLKIANWKRAAHDITSQLVRDLNTAQTGLSEAYGRICTDLQVLMGDVVKKAYIVRREADTLRRDSVQLTLETRQVVLSTSKQLSEVFKRTAVQPFLSASSVLQGQTLKVNKEARQMMSGTWGRISNGAQRLDFRAIIEHVRNAHKCKALDKAQKRARRLMRGKAS